MKKKRITSNILSKYVLPPTAPGTNRTRLALKDGSAQDNIKEKMYVRYK
jgi:hypothetical protein